jgi:hypothetical protein
MFRFLQHLQCLQGHAQIVNRLEIYGITSECAPPESDGDIVIILTGTEMGEERPYL